MAAIQCYACGCEREEICEGDVAPCNCETVLEWGEVLRRVNALHSVRLCRYESYQFDGTVWEYVKSIPDSDSTSYGDFHDTDSPDTDCYAMPNYLSGGDYAGSTLEAANYRAFNAEIPTDDDGNEVAGFHEVHGGYGTFAWAISLTALQRHPEILELLESLENYPVLDEEELSRYEMELSEAAWDSWAASDTEAEIEKQFGIDIDDTGKRFSELFHTVADRAGEYWECDGADMSIRVEKVVREMTIENLAEYGIQFSVSGPINGNERIDIEDLHEHKIEYDETITSDGSEYQIAVSYDPQGIQFGVETQHGHCLGFHRTRDDAIQAIISDRQRNQATKV